MYIQCTADNQPCTPNSGDGGWGGEGGAEGHKSHTLAQVPQSQLDNGTILKVTARPGEVVVVVIREKTSVMRPKWGWW
jgi:hypothetical protein